MADTAFAAVFGEERVSDGERAVGHVPDIVLSRPVVHYMRQGDKRVRISWNKDELSSVINKRVSKLFKSKYTSEEVELKYISTPVVGLQPLMSYVSDRTMMRPRDFLAFFNKLFDKFGGSSMIHQKDVRSIELDFSTERRRALVDEWKSFYPYVDSLIGFLSNRSLSAEFRMGSVEKNVVDDLVLLLHTKFDSHDDSLMEYVKIYFRDNNDTNRFELLRRIFVALYRVGAIGIKTQANSRVQFSFTNRPNIDGAELNENTPCLVHPMLWQNLSRRGEAKNLFN